MHTDTDTTPELRALRDAIVRSSSYGEIVHLPYTVEADDALLARPDREAGVDTPEVSEHWGGAGALRWRVHLDMPELARD